MADTQLVEQPSKKPVRKLRISAYVMAALTVGVYVFGAIEGNEIINEDAAFDGIRVLLSGLLPWVAAYFAKSEASEAGE